MSTKKSLSDAPGADEGEFDVDFGEGELGMRLEERGSFKASSVVVRVTEDGKCLGARCASLSTIRFTRFVGLGDIVVLVETKTSRYVMGQEMHDVNFQVG